MTDTGPDYPADLAPSSQGLGSFAIGVGQIGDIVPFSFWTTILSQYANSPIITQLIGQFQVCVDQTENMSNFYDDMWNIATAEGYGLDCWGRIVGVTRNLQVADSQWFGFGSALPGSQPYSYGAFYSGAPITSTYSLSDNSYRELIYAKAMSNISNGSIASINSILRALFTGRGNCYVSDGVNNGSWFGFQESINGQPFNQAAFYDGETIMSMAMQYVFSFPLQPFELAIVMSSGVLPKPTGVPASVVFL